MAKACGKLNTNRAVGTAISKNLNALKVPCHRVVKSFGGVGQYAANRGIKNRGMKKR